MYWSLVTFYSRETFDKYSLSCIQDKNVKSVQCHQIGAQWFNMNCHLRRHQGETAIYRVMLKIYNSYDLLSLVRTKLQKDY